MVGILVTNESSWSITWLRRMRGGEKGTLWQSIQLKKKNYCKMLILFFQCMILDICQLIQDFLHQANEKVPKLSFHEEMLKNQESRKRQESCDEQKLQREEAEEIARELERRRAEQGERTRLHSDNYSPTKGPILSID